LAIAAIGYQELATVTICLSLFIAPTGLTRRPSPSETFRIFSATYLTSLPIVADVIMSKRSNESSLRIAPFSMFSTGY
jgi:hypothetical protein